MRLLALLLISLSSCAALAHDETPCTDEADSKWQPFSNALKKAENAGFHPKAAEIHHHCYEVKGVDNKGDRFEWILNPITLEPRPEKK